MTQTTISLTEALKDHLRNVKDDTTGVSTLHEALLHIIDNPHPEEVVLDGYEKTLNDPVKVSKETLGDVKKMRDDLNASDYEAAIRQKANIRQRDLGEEPVEITKELD